MKFGIRKPSLKKSLSARTTGRAKRSLKSFFIPFYGKKNTGLIKDPKKSLYNRAYKRTTIDIFKKLR